MKQYAGLTLLETMLVLVIMMVAFTLGLNMYYLFKADSDIRQVQSNVDAIFQAMAQYYRVNCLGTVQPDGSILPGSLNPRFIPAPPALKSINIQTDLITPGFLTLPLVRGPIVIATGAGTNGYVAQFNRITVQRSVCMSGVNAVGANSLNCVGSPANVGQVQAWLAQVSVQMKDNVTATRYVQKMGANCSSSVTGGTVIRCSSNQPGPFVVWERSPSSSSETRVSGSTYWGTMQVVKQFNQMYTTNPVTSLTNGTATANQYYMCGN